MINQSIDEIKNEIKNKYSDKIIFEEFLNNKNNTFEFENKIYQFKTAILKTIGDGQQFIKFIYSIITENEEMINLYDSFKDELKIKLLYESAFPKNQHVIPQNILANWIKDDSSYYITQNNHNGKVTVKKANGASQFLSEYNLFTRFIGNKILTIETGFFKYVDNSFMFLGEKAKSLEEEQEKTITNNREVFITKNSEVYEKITALYRFLVIYIRHTKGVKSIDNKNIDWLLTNLLDFKNIHKTLDETFKVFTTEEISKKLLGSETYLKKLFNSTYSMSFVKILKNTDFNFIIGFNWCTHSQITVDEGNNQYMILFPLSPNIAILIYKDEHTINNFIKDDIYFKNVMKQSLLQYLSYLKYENGLKVLTQDYKNFENYDVLINEKGSFDHLQDYVDIDIVGKSQADLISEKINTDIITYAQRIYVVIETSIKGEHFILIKSKVFENNIVKKIEINTELQERIFYFNKIGNMVGFKFLDLDTGHIHNHGETD